MTIDVIFKIVELFGIMAVVASVGFLALETRAANISQEQQSYSLAIGPLVACVGDLKRDPSLIKLYADGLADFHGLSTEDKWRFGALMQEYVWTFHASWIWDKNRQWASSRSEVASDIPGIRAIIVRPGFRAWWPAGKKTIPLEFATYLDGILDLSDEADEVSFRFNHKEEVNSATKQG